MQRVHITVHNDALTLLVLSHAPATLDTDLHLMVILVMVNLIYHYLLITSLEVNLSIDINECTEGTSGCSHTCSNTVGSYTCSCRTGYRLARDNHGCNG